MKSRHRAREVALQILYRYDSALQASGAAVPQDEDLAHELRQHFDHFQVPPALREFAAELVAGTLTHQPRLDQILEKHVSNWKVARMGMVDRSLLRMAAYEMLHFPETAPSVIIDEAIELGKQFGNEDTPAFVNGILDAIKTALPELLVPALN